MVMTKVTLDLGEPAENRIDRGSFSMVTGKKE
jgi:hypothetical protein